MELSPVKLMREKIITRMRARSSPVKVNMNWAITALRNLLA